MQIHHKSRHHDSRQSIVDKSWGGLVLMQCTSSLVATLQAETFPAAEEGGPPRLYQELPFEERDKALKDRLKKYCQKVG